MGNKEGLTWGQIEEILNNTNNELNTGDFYEPITNVLNRYHKSKERLFNHCGFKVVNRYDWHIVDNTGVFWHYDNNRNILHFESVLHFNIFKENENLVNGTYDFKYQTADMIMILNNG